MIAMSASTIFSAHIRYKRDINAILINKSPMYLIKKNNHMEVLSSIIFCYKEITQALW